MKLTSWIGWPLLLGGLLLLGCQRDAPPRPTAPERPAVTPPVDLGAVIRQVHFSFRHEGGAFQAGHPTHAITARRDGRVELTAYAPARGPGSRPERGGSLALRTVESSRRGDPLHPAVQARLRDDGALVLARGPVLEHLVNTARGLHQSWVFEVPPEGRGDLVVRLAVSGAAYQGETAGGLHFRDPRTPAGIRYGHAVWIDARGERTPVRARFKAGEISIRVPAAVVDRSSFPAVLDPYISPEIQTDAPIIAEAYGAQGNARVSTNGANYLVVWDDYRDPATGTDILGARLNLTGALLDPRGFIICNQPGEQRLPAVADDNSGQYFVVWQDDRNTASQGWDLYGTIVPASGLPAPVVGAPLVDNPGDQTEPSIAYDGTTATNPAFFSAWTDTRAGTADIFGAHLERDGGVREAGGFVVSNPINVQNRPAVAHDGSAFVVAWQDYRNNPSAPGIYARRVSSTGTTLEPEIAVATPANAAAQGPSVAGGSSFALIAWADYRDSTTSGGADIWGEILAGGAVQAPGSFAICDAGYEQKAPAVAFDGSRFNVVWQDGRGNDGAGVYGTTVSTAGVPSSLAGLSLSASGSSPQLASGAVNPLMVYEDFTPLGGSDVYARVLTGFFAPGNPILLSTSANTQGRPAVGFDGTRYLVVWEDNRTPGNSTDLWGTRVSAQGQVLDPSGIPISTAPGAQQRPAVAGGAGAFAVAWEDYRNPEEILDCSGFVCRPCYVAGDLYANIVNGDGGVLSPGGITLADAGAAQLDPAVTFDGQRYFVAWADDRESPGECRISRGGPDPTEIHGAWITPQGAVTLPKDELPLLTDPAEIYSTRIATLGDRHLLGWQNDLGGRFGPIIAGGSVAVLAADGGALLSPPQSLASATAQGFTVAADGARFWTAWQENRTDGGVDVLVQPVDPAGNAGAAVVAAGSGALESDPALAFDGQNLVLAFHVSYQEVLDGVFVQWLDANGTPLPPGPVVVNDSPGTSGAIGAVGDGQRRTLVTYQKYDPTLAVSAQRVRSNLVQLLSQDGAPCASGATCFSGFCVDGVCCESACGGGAAASSCTACSPAAGSPAAAGLCRPRAQGTVCRPASSGCRADATCDGTGAACPANALRGQGAVCRPAADACDAQETCDGQGPECPADQKARDGTTCGDTMVCQAGACEPVEPESLYNSCAGCSAGPTALALPLAVLLHRLGRRRRRGARAGRWTALGLLALLSLPLPAQAANAAQPDKAKLKLAFLGISATTGVPPEMAASFSEYLQSEVTALQAYNVIGVGEIRQLLGLERQRQLLGCSEESSCVAEMAGALDADRAIFGDVARLGDSMVLNVSLMDLKRGKLLSRVGKRVPGTGVEALLDVARPVVYELLRPDPALEGRPLVLEKGFGGLRVGVRADADVVGPGVAPGLSADVSTRVFGGGLTLLYGNGVGVRAEGRLYPMELDRVRPYAGAGATLFVPRVGPVVGLRGVAGAEVRFGSFSLTADVAYERFLTDSPLFRQTAVLLGAGMGYLF